jgi:rubredoxin
VSLYFYREAGAEQNPDGVTWHCVQGKNLSFGRSEAPEKTAAAICGVTPGTVWADYRGERITCPDCLLKLAERQRVIINAPAGLTPEQNAEIDGLCAELGVTRKELEKQYARIDRSRRREATSLAKWYREQIETFTNPRTVKDAYFRHYYSNPYPPRSKEGKAWLKDHPRFAWDGAVWRWSYSVMLSNSGKSVRDYGQTFFAEDGRTSADPRLPPNRRNDPERNWGLPE